MSAYEAYRRLVEASGEGGGEGLLGIWAILLPLVGLVALAGFVRRFTATCQGPVPDAGDKP